MTVVQSAGARDRRHVDPFGGLLARVPGAGRPVLIAARSGPDSRGDGQARANQCDEVGDAAL